MTTLKIGIATYEEMKARTLAVARGDLTPKAEDPKVWSTSVDGFEWLEAELLKGLTGPETPLNLAEVKTEGLRLLAARRATEGK